MLKWNVPLEEIKEHIRNSHPKSVIMFGCDSTRRETKGKAWANYATVVCVRRASGEGDDIIYHGSKVFGAINTLPDYGKVISSGKIANLRMRLMQEVTYVLEAYEELKDVIEDREWEIHIDINSKEDTESHAALAEARGYVMGMTGGYAPEFKPNALAASFAADMWSRGLIN